MPRYAFSPKVIADERLELNLIYDFECEVEVNREDGNLQVDGVLLNGKYLENGGRLARALATEVTLQAEHELETYGLLWSNVVNGVESAPHHACRTVGEAA